MCRLFGGRLGGSMGLLTLIALLVRFLIGGGPEGCGCVGLLGPGCGTGGGIVQLLVNISLGGGLVGDASTAGEGTRLGTWCGEGSWLLATNSGHLWLVSLVMWFQLVGLSLGHLEGLWLLQLGAFR